MSDKPKLTLPEKKSKSPPAFRIIFVLLVVLSALAVANLMLLTLPKLQSRLGGESTTTIDYSELALKLEKQDLQTPAIEVWKEYLVHEQHNAQKKANLWYRIGTLYQDVGEYEKALESYYRSELLAKVDEISFELNRRIEESLEALGRYSALRHEVKERVTYNEEQESAETSSSPSTSLDEVVAEIAGISITEADLDREIEDLIEFQLSQYRQYLPPEEMNKQKEAFFKQYSTPQQRVQILNGLIVEEILFRKAREDKIHEDPLVREMIRDAEKQILAQQFVALTLADQIKISNTDLEAYYQSHLDDYVHKERAQITHVVFEDERAASKALVDLFSGTLTFESLTASTAQDKITPPEWVEKGSLVPGIGESEEATVAIFTTKSNALVSSIIQSARGYHIIRVLVREPQRQRGYSEAESDVYRDLYLKKEQEIQTQLLDELKQKYNVIIYSAKLQEE